jgi:hypothetical protein
MFTAAPQGGGRGAGLLLAHCAAMGRLDVAGHTAFERLEALVGGELAGLLVRALGTARAAR